MITLYGAVRSRGARCMWMLEELGQEYEHVDIAPLSEESRAAEYLAINPNGKVPSLRDGETVLWESMAINLYLADKYGGELKPKARDGFAMANQWSYWGMLEMEAHLLVALFNRVLSPEEERDAAKADAAEEALQRPLKVLDGKLQGRDYLLGDTFSVADLNVAAILSWGKMARINLDSFPNVKKWLGACLGREAYQKVFARR